MDGTPDHRTFPVDIVIESLVVKSKVSDAREESVKEIVSFLIVSLLYCLIIGIIEENLTESLSKVLAKLKILSVFVVLHAL